MGQCAWAGWLYEYGVEVTMEVDADERGFCLEVEEPAHELGDCFVCDRYKTSKMTKHMRGRGMRGMCEGRGRGVEELEIGY